MISKKYRRIQLHFLLNLFCITAFQLLPLRSDFRYEFSKVSFEQGVRRIHSPEHFRKHLPLFKIHNTSEVLQVGKWVGIEVECRLGWKTYVVCMCTNKRTENRLYILKNENEYWNMTFQVYESRNGHEFGMNIAGISKYEKMMIYALVWCLSFCDDVMWVYDFGTHCDANLAKYRRIVVFL